MVASTMVHAQREEYPETRIFCTNAQLEVQWAYSVHLVHPQWGTVHTLHAIYSGHCSYTVARQSVHTVATYSVHTVDTLSIHCIHTAVYSAHCSYTVTRYSAHCYLQWVKRVCTARTVGTLYSV